MGLRTQPAEKAAVSPPVSRKGQIARWALVVVFAGCLAGGHGYLDTLLCLNRLMNPVPPLSPFSLSPRELVDNHNFVG